MPHDEVASGAFTVRRATSADVGAIAPLFDAYRGFYQQQPEPEVARTFLADRIARDESVVLFAVSPTDPTDVHGFVQLYPSFSSVAAGATWILNDLYVAPEARRRGVGRALMEAAHGFARATGAVRVDLATEPTNERAKALYASLGYEPTPVFEHYSLHLARGHG